MKHLFTFFTVVVICCFSITSFAQFDPIPKTLCDIVSIPIDEMDVITFGIVSDNSSFDKFDLTFDGCTILCDGDFGLMPLEGMLIIVEGRVQEEDALEDLAINVRYWIPYQADPPDWPSPIVFTAEEAIDADVGTIALLFGYVQQYTDEGEGVGTFTDGTASLFIDFIDGDSPDVSQQIYVLGVMELNNAENPVLSVTYWYPEGGDPPPPPPPVAWNIEEANSLPLGSYCFILGSVSSWTNETLGEGIYHDEANSMNIDFESDIAMLPNLDASIFTTGRTGEDMDERVIEAHHWFPEELIGLDDPVEIDIKIQLYPNPVSNVLNIEADQDIQMISLYNPAGQLIYSAGPTSGKTRLDLSVANSGLYFIRIETNDGLTTHKIIIE